MSEISTSPMRAIMQDILRMPYYRNFQASSGAVHAAANHESAIESILIQHQLTKTVMPQIVAPATKKGIPRYIKVSAALNELLAGKHNDLIPDNTYISQPCGTHKSPDFIVKAGGVLRFLEAKSSMSKTGAPIYNGGLPHPDYIYVFCNQFYNATTVFYGRDVLPTPIHKLLMAAYNGIRKMLSGVNSTLKIHAANDRGWSYYGRAMYVQKGGKSKVNYFEHAKRRQCEQNVLESV